MRISNLVDDILEAGEFAFSSQAEATRSFKSDGSVITQIDTAINESLSKRIKTLFPDANLITEEAASYYDSSRKYTFVLDPLDGTDAYSMGMPSWCISLGVLKNLEPVGGIVYAPAWGLKYGSFIFSDIDDTFVEINGNLVEPCSETAFPLQVMAPARVNTFFNISDFSGKIRNTGSSVISMLSVLLHSQISGALINQSFIWDIAASHAIMRKCGFEPEYMSGGKIDYSKITDRTRLKDFLVCGTAPAMATIRENFKYKK